jgi:hypothetical protein
LRLKDLPDCCATAGDVSAVTKKQLFRWRLRRPRAGNHLLSVEGQKRRWGVGKNTGRGKRRDTVVMVYGINGPFYIPTDDAERAIGELLKARLMWRQGLTAAEAEEWMTRELMVSCHAPAAPGNPATPAGDDAEHVS